MGQVRTTTAVDPYRPAQKKQHYLALFEQSLGKVWRHPRFQNGSVVASESVVATAGDESTLAEYFGREPIQAVTVTPNFRGILK